MMYSACKWFIRIGHFWGLQVGSWEMPCSKNLAGYSYINKVKVGRGRDLLCLFWVFGVFSSLVPPPGWAGEFSSPWVVKLGSQIIVFNVCREHVLGIINLLSSLGRMWGSCHHCFIVQLLSRARLFATPWTTACQASLSITNSQSLLKLMSIGDVI